MTGTLSSIFSSHSGSIIDRGEHCKFTGLPSSRSSGLSDDDEDLESSLLGGIGSRGGRFRKFGKVGGRMRLSGLPRGPIGLRGPIDPKGPPIGSTPLKLVLMDLGVSERLFGGLAAVGVPKVKGGIGCPVLPASFAICCRIFCTFSGGSSGEHTPCFFNSCTLRKYLLQNSLQQNSQNASAFMTPICLSLSGVREPVGTGPSGLLGTLGTLGIGL